NMCLRPRDKEKADYWYCHQFGMSILPWRQPDGSFDPDEWADPDDLNRAFDGELPCGDVGRSKKGEMVADGLHDIGRLRAHHRKARSYCKDGTTVETEYLVLPVTGLTVVIDKLSPQRRAQVEGILRSFTFPGESRPSLCRPAMRGLSAPTASCIDWAPAAWARCTAPSTSVDNASPSNCSTVNSRKIRNSAPGSLVKARCLTG